MGRMRMRRAGRHTYGMAANCASTSARGMHRLLRCGTGAQLGRLGPRRSRIRRALAALLRRGVVRGRRYTSTQCCGSPARPRTAAPPASSCCNVQRRSRLRSSSSRAGRRTTPHACATRRRYGRCVLCVACCTLHVAWSGITSPHACATRASATAVVFLRFGHCSAAARGWSGLVHCSSHRL